MASVLLVALAVALMAWRFTRLDLAAFINDEPRFLEGGHDQVRTGRWLSASPLTGTQGVRYGPTVFWFYGLVGLLGDEHPRTATAAMCAVVTLAQVALVWALARVFGGGLPAFAALLAFVASSPYQFFWSRLAWDQTVDAMSAAVVAVLALSARPGWKTGLAVGALTGLAVSSHLMVLPFVAALTLVLAAEAWAPAEGRSRALAFAAVTAAAMLAVNLPYLHFLAGAPPTPMHAVTLDVRTLAAYALEPARVATTWGIEYFFDDDWGDFLAWLGAGGSLLPAGPAVAVGLAAVTLLGLVAALRSPDPRARRLGRLGLLTWLIAPLVLATRTLLRHPHYQFGTWWLVPVGLAAALAWLRARDPRAGRAGAAALWLLAGLQCAFIGAWGGYVDERVGTRGLHYGTPLREQQVVMEALCRQPGTRLTLRNDTALFRRPLVYWSRVLPECRGKQVLVCGGGARAGFLACPEPGAEDVRARLVYARDKGGALRLESDGGPGSP